MISSKAVPFLVLLTLTLVPAVSRASGPDPQYCTDWRLGSTQTRSDGGVVSSQCTCQSWDGYGDQYGCDLCQAADAGNYCLQRSEYPLNKNGCSVSGGGLSLALLVLLAGLSHRRRSLPL